MKAKKKLSQRGVALLLAIFTFVLVSGIAVELLEETQVEYISATQNMNSIKSYYSAKAGVELSLLRILIYKKAITLAGDALNENKTMLDKIWSFPFMWPPQLPEDATIVAKDLLKSSLEETLIDSAFATTISAEGSKIDINALASKSKALAKNTKELLQKLFANRIQNDDNFGDKYREADIEELLNNMTDWIDEDEESLNGGDESGYYRGFSSQDFPPNQPFKTLQELHMVEGMTDEIFDILAPNVTVYGSAGINVNQADKEVLMSIDPGIDEEMADEIIAHRNDEENGGPFANLEKFLGFLQSKGLTLDQEKMEKEGIPLFFDEALNFRIVSTATVGQTSREVVAIVYDFDRVKGRLAKIIKERGEKEGDSENNEDVDPELEQKCKDKEGEEKYKCLCEKKTPEEAKNQCIEEQRKKAEAAKKEEEKKKKPPKGRPNVVFWYEK